MILLIDHYFFNHSPQFYKIIVAATIADAKTLMHIPDADVVVKVKQGEEVISTLEEEYSGYDVFVGYTFQKEGQYKVALEISVPNDAQQ